MKGTITWYKCSDILPPPAKAKPFGYSVEVLVTDGITCEKGVYCHNPSHEKPFWQEYYLKNDPTHWAYINFPEPD